jgi:hypothetical protein
VSIGVPGPSHTLAASSSAAVGAMERLSNWIATLTDDEFATFRLT